MILIAWRQLVRRGGRSLALALAILLAASGFTVLTASAEASRLATVGQVEAHFRTAYDILVRPKGARSPTEATQGLVQPGFLTGLYGGITLTQWRQIQHLSGVQVAAPIAMVGYAYPRLQVPVDVSKTWPATGDAVTRVDVTWKGDNGLTVTQGAPEFAYITSDALRFNEGARAGAGSWVDTSPGRAPTSICPSDSAYDPRPERGTPSLTCFSRTRGGASSAADLPRNRGLKGEWLTFPLAYVVAAVDPASEDALVGLDSALTSGRSLADAPTSYPAAIDGKGAPVLAADTVPTNETARIDLSTLPSAAATAVTRGASAQALIHFPATHRSRRTVSAQLAHQILLHDMRTTKPVTQMREVRLLPGEILQLSQVGLPTINPQGQVELTPPSPPDQAALERDGQYQAPASDDLQSRKVTTSRKYGDAGQNATPATLYLRGTFNPERLQGLTDLTAQLLAGYTTAPTVGADTRSRHLLGGKPLAPSSTLSGFLQPPPLMITTLSALPQLQFGGWAPTTGAAPISAVRVRVAGVTGSDPASRERVRLAAQRIQQTTGLEVDITIGSSPTRKTLTLPAGLHGRPLLQLQQWWLKKGVAVTILQQVDKKSLALFMLVLLVSGLSVANSATASVRARRTELGILACVGWSRAHLFRSVLTELTIIAGLSGIAASGLALGAAALLGTPITVARALLAIPAALLVALAAGMMPAWLATKADPMDAVRPVVTGPRRAASPRTISTLAWVNIKRTKARTALAALGLLIGVATFTVLLGITLGFQGAVVGTVLGDAVAIQARGADYAAVAATLILAGLGVANVIYLNVRDRGAELATLRAVGWAPAHLDRLIVTEGLIIGTLGAVPGAALGLTGAAALTHTRSMPLLVAALIALALALLIATAASATASRLVRRLPTTVLLTE